MPVLVTLEREDGVLEGLADMAAKVNRRRRLPDLRTVPNARNELGGMLPPGLTVGGFFSTPKPASPPPESFLEYYLGTLQLVAEQIIRR